LWVRADLRATYAGALTIAELETLKDGEDIILATLREPPDVLAQRKAVSRHYLLLFKSVEFGAQVAQ
jgi:hypothetical protein